jgi:uroporphyrinogen decarboxylase
MNLRERFHEIMGFQRTRSIKWEFGYWGETIERWYKEGLPRQDYPRLPSEKATTPTSHLYSKAWNSLKGSRLPNGIAVTAGGLYWPTQGFPLDDDVKNHFHMDDSQILVNVNLLFHPMFESKIIEEDENHLVYIDLDGVRRRFLKETATMPSGEDWPIKDWDSWQQIKEERLSLSDVSGRFPPNWDDLAAAYRDRDFPLALGGYPHGFFGTLAHLMGYEKLFISYFEDPGLVHDVVNTFTDLWIAVYSEVLQYVDIDDVHIWEDISYGSGSMVSPSVIKEFMIPYYKKFTDFLRSKGVDIILVDTDGDCFDIIPLFLEGGITGMYPFEVSCGIDIVEIRKSFPGLQMMGGIPKSELIHGKRRIQEILEPVRTVLKTGGFIPFGDHLIPPEVSWENFSFYRERLNSIIDESGD